MADIAISEYIARVFPDKDECYSFYASEALSQGHVVTWSADKLAKAATADGKVSVVLGDAVANGIVEVIVRGWLYWPGVSGITAATILEVGTTDGVLDDAGVASGNFIVIQLTDGQKCVYVDCSLVA